MLTSLGFVLLLGLALGALAVRLRLPSLVGMLLAGILLGPYVLNLLSPALQDISADLRQLALVIILTRAGLSLDLADLRRAGRPAILMCFLPATFEMLGMVVLAPRLLGVSPLDAAIMGAVVGAVSPAVIVPRMLRLMEDGLREGAAGLSLGLMYEPGMYADLDELRKVAALCVKYGKPLTVHSRALSKISTSYKGLFGRSHLLRAVDELVKISKNTKLKLQISHAIFMGRKSLGDKDEFVQLVNSMRSEGVDVMFDIYNQLRGLSVITVILPVWYQAMPREKRDSAFVRMRLKILAAAATRLLGFGFDDMVVAYIGPGYERFEGKSVHRIAQEEGMGDVDMYLKLCELSGFHGRISLGPCTTPEIISEFEKNPLCLYMTDAWVEDDGIQKPAIYDCFPKFLRDSLLGTGDTMPNTVRRMTGATADRFMLSDRGYLRRGCFADVTVFDEDTVKSGVPDQQRAFGIEKVFINGKLVLDGNELDTNALRTSGRAVSVQ